jgi:hypothetical protein
MERVLNSKKQQTKYFGKLGFKFRRQFLGTFETFYMNFQTRSRKKPK